MSQTLTIDIGKLLTTQKIHDTILSTEAAALTQALNAIPNISNFISMATETQQLGKFLAFGAGTIGITDPVTSTDISLLDSSLAAKALCHKQFQEISLSAKVTGTLSLASATGLKCTYFAITMNDPKQLEEFIRSDKVTDQLDINATISILMPQ